MFKRCCIFISLIVLPIISIWAQEVQLNLSASGSFIRIGEPLTVTITAHYNAAQVNLQWPKMQMADDDPYAVLEVSVFPARSMGKRYFQECRISVTAYDSGIFSLPQWKIRVLNDSSKSFSIPQFTFLAQTVPTDTNITKLKPLKTILDVPFDWAWYTSEIVLSFIGLAILLLVIWYVIKRNKNRNTLKNQPIVPPDIQALEHLDELLKQEVWKTGNVKLYYSQLTEILKTYIEKRFQCSVMERTTAELLIYIRNHITDTQILNALERILTHSDFAKFAKQFHSEALHRELLNLSKSFVEQTRLNTNPHS